MRWAGVETAGRISTRRTATPAAASCHAASQPASPPPTTVTIGSGIVTYLRAGPSAATRANRRYLHRFAAFAGFAVRGAGVAAFAGLAARAGAFAARVLALAAFAEGSPARTAGSASRTLVGFGA